MYTSDDLGAAQRDARTLLDAGCTVSLRRAAEGTEQAVDGDVVIALAKHARDARFAGDRAVAYRVIRTEAGATVVWLMLAGEARGMPGAWLPFRVREITRDGSVALEVLPL